jgi:hypothetical protein
MLQFIHSLQLAKILEVLIAYIIREYACLKRRISTRSQSATFQKTVIFIFAVVRTLNLTPEERNYAVLPVEAVEHCVETTELTKRSGFTRAITYYWWQFPNIAY